MRQLFFTLLSIISFNLLATNTILVAWDGGEGVDYADSITVPDEVYGFLKPSILGILNNVGSNDNTFGAVLGGADTSSVSYKVRPNFMRSSY